MNNRDEGVSTNRRFDVAFLKFIPSRGHGSELFDDFGDRLDRVIDVVIAVVLT